MQARLREGELKGTLPILYAFLARSGKTIHEASLVNLDKDGVAHEVERHGPAPRGVRYDPGVKIVFTDGNGPRQTLYYFATDLSDAGTRNSGFLKFSDKLGAGDCAPEKRVLSAARRKFFSNVRQFLLDRSQTIVQDDTGVPVRFSSRTTGISSRSAPISDRSRFSRACTSRNWRRSSARAVRRNSISASAIAGAGTTPIFWLP
jgi:hypothetical protein